MRKRIIFLFAVMLFTVFFYGVSVGLYQIYPYQFFNLVKEVVLAENLRSQEDIVDKVTVSSIINIENESDIQKKKEALNQLIWKTKSIPNSYPDVIDKNILDERFNDTNNLKQIDKFSIEMEHGLLSHVYLFLPENSNNQLIIYHQGHAGGFINGKTTINYFLKNGYTIAAFSMPLVGMNNQPIVNLEHLGPIKFTGHKQFPLLETDDFSPISYFVTPVTHTLNYLDDNYNFTDYYMIGISGGGWTSTIYSAIDTRISKSFSINGSLPLFLRVNPEDVGDWEALHPDLLKIANYLELYVMSSYGEKREHIQIFNKYDPCCFAGLKYEHYEVEIQQIVSNLGKGNFNVISDDTHNQHMISNFALELIEKNLKK
jgi:hypothetical protein